MPVLKTSKNFAVPYDDPDFDYPGYWHNRSYEHKAQLLALKRLLKGKHFTMAADIGGGYGRLTVELGRYADNVVLAEPRQRQLDLAVSFLREHPEIERRKMPLEKLSFADGSVDLLTAVRVMHRLQDPTPLLAEINRVLSESGFAIIEVANYLRPAARAKRSVRKQVLGGRPLDVVVKGHSEQHFINHNPHTVISQLAHAGLKVDRILSVANLRSPSLNKVMPQRVMLAIEGLLQPVLSHGYVGPSIFFLVRRAR